MGFCFSSPAASMSADIDHTLHKDKIKKRQEATLLLLGAGESGKSTVLKQMKLLHGGGFSPTEKEMYRSAIFYNIFCAIHAIIEECHSLASFSYSNPKNLQHEAFLLQYLQPPQLESGEPFPSQFLIPIQSLWSDSNVQEALLQTKMTVYNDSSMHFFKDLDRVFHLDFKPSNEDILLTRIKSTGIMETSISMDNITYRMLDVGGQRSERKKWIHCFENVTAVIFMAALSCYDQSLLEDDQANQMKESLLLFNAIINSYWFEKTSIILLLNKIDLFRRKLPLIPLKTAFPEYEGPEADFNASCSFIKQKFLSLQQKPEKLTYVHYTHATNSEQFSIIINHVNDVIVRENLRKIGLI